MQQLLNNLTGTSVDTVEEKIHLEKQLPFDPYNKRGPTTDLYFHELTTDHCLGSKVLQYAVGTLLLILFVLTLPVAALLIRCTSHESVFRKISATGRRGIEFELYCYPTSHSNSSKSFLFGSFLKKSRIYKLPSVINLCKGDINLVGPHPYPKEWCNKWNKELSDYYKRFAVHPGFVGISKQISNPEYIEDVASTLKKELNYIHHPSFKTELKILLG